MGILLQCYATLAASFGGFMMGFYYTWPSYTLELYTSQNTTLLSAPLSDLEISLIGSMPTLGSILGATIASTVMDTIGRQKGGVVLSLPVAVSWSIIYLTSSSTVILIARFIVGITGGAFMVYGPMFISEVAQDSIRGRLVAAPTFTFCIGCTISYIIGWFLSYQAIIWINILLGVISVIQFYLLVESPNYLIRRGRDAEARTAIAKYRGGSFKSISEELARLKTQITLSKEFSSIKEKNEKTIEQTQREKLQPTETLYMDDGQKEPQVSPLKLLCTSPGSRRAFAVVFTHTILQMCMSVVPVSVYAKAIFAETTPSLSGHLCSVLFGIMLCGGITVATIIFDRAGRRSLLISSSILIALSIGSLAFLLQTKLAPPWTAAVLILVYCFAFYLGAGSVPFVLMAESFIPKVQGLASTLIINGMFLVSFFNIAMIPVINRLVGVHGTFYFFAAVAVINTVAGYLWVPETKGLSYEQIQEVYASKKK